MTEVYQQQDLNSQIYDGSAITADGDGAVLDFSTAGGCPDGELIFKLSNRATGESVTITLGNYNGSTYDTLPLRLSGLAADGVYVIPINNKVITGSKLKVSHDVTLPTAGSINLHGHFRPFN